MKKRFCQIATTAALLSGLPALISSSPASPTENYTLEWQDEFEGPQLDTSKWAYREDNKHQSLQRRENVSVINGTLRLDLRVLEKPNAGKRLSGAGVVSKPRFRYGYYEVRAKLGNQRGTERGWHHSFWVTAADMAGDSVASTHESFRRTEIDCFENPTEHLHEPDLNTLNRFSQHVIIWNTQGTEWGRLPEPPRNRTVIPNFDASQWHTYAFEWNPEQVRFYVDGQLTHIAAFPANKHIHDEVNVWLTAISANWNQSANAIPSKAEYDYFRYYTFKKLAPR